MSENCLKQQMDKYARRNASTKAISSALEATTIKAFAVIYLTETARKRNSALVTHRVYLKVSSTGHVHLKSKCAAIQIKLLVKRANNM